MTRVAGLDIGSTATKCVLMEDGRVIASVVVSSMPDMRVAAERDRSSATTRTSSASCDA